MERRWDEIFSRLERLEAAVLKKGSKQEQSSTEAPKKPEGKDKAK